MTKQWNFRREANAAKAEILIYEDIGDGMFGGLTAKMFLEQLSALGPVPELDIRINSWGGIASEGIAMFNGLDRHPAQKTIYVDAMAASAATVVAMAASPGRLIIAPNARFMVHPAWTGEVGNRHDFTSTAARLTQLDEQIAAMYAKRTGKRAAAMLKLMDADRGRGTYLTGAEAVAEGLCDQVAAEPSDQNVPRVGRELSWLKPPAELFSKPIDHADDDADAVERTAAAVAVRMRLAELDLVDAEK